MSESSNGGAKDHPIEVASQTGEVPAPPSAGTLITRRQAAQVLETSTSSIRRMEKRATLTPAAIGADGTRLFELGQVQQIERQVVRSRSAVAAPDAYDGEMARDTFSMFDQGLTPVEVVKRTAFDPRAVEAMYGKWTSLRGGFFVPGEIVAKIASLPWHRGFGLLGRDENTAEQLLACLKANIRPESCTTCDTEFAQFCAACAKALSIKEAERRHAESRARTAETARHRREVDFQQSRERRFRGLARATKSDGTESS